MVYRHLLQQPQPPSPALYFDIAVAYEDFEQMAHGVELELSTAKERSITAPDSSLPIYCYRRFLPNGFPTAYISQVLKPTSEFCLLSIFFF